MSRLVLSRFVRAVATLWIVVTLVFFGLRLSGDPFELMLGDSATPEDMQLLREAYGLDQSLPIQYGRYVASILGGDFGMSLQERRPASEVVFERLPATLRLAVVAIGMSVALGIPTGVLAAMYRNSAIDRFVVAISFVGQAVPGFILGILLIFIFTLWLGWLPSSGSSGWQSMVLPVTALGWGSLATVARITRSSMLEVQNADYVRTARAKGLTERRILIAHSFRNAAIAILTMFGLLVGTAIAGAIVIETVFAWPGMGRVIQRSVQARDYPVIQFVVLLIAISVVIINFAVDIAYGIIDPRIRQGGSA